MAIVTNFNDWTNILRNKWLILDSCVIVDIFKYNSEDLLKIFKEENVTLCTLHPIVLQSLNTDNQAERVKIRSFIHNQVSILPMTDLFEKAEETQQKFIESGCRPDAIDFYLASVIAKYAKNNKTFLATSNLKHFQRKFFDRVGYILLEDDSSIRTISLLIPSKENTENNKDKEMPF